MYTQALDTQGAADAAPKTLRSTDEMALQQRFDERIDAGDFIEARIGCPRTTARR
jgi:ring-1,2-phenylacetyl-CoA epoxidase subunit PaaA